MGYRAILLKILDCRKTFNDLNVSPLAKLHHQDKWFSYLLCSLNILDLQDSTKQTVIDLKTQLNNALLSWFSSNSQHKFTKCYY